jgi:hypothetical protein
MRRLEEVSDDASAESPLRWWASVGELHLGQHVGGEELALGSVLLSVAYVHKLSNLSGQLFYPTC